LDVRLGSGYGFQPMITTNQMLWQDFCVRARERGAATANLVAEATGRRRDCLDQGAGDERPEAAADSNAEEFQGGTEGENSLVTTTLIPFFKSDEQQRRNYTTPSS
jgi:hypothetical protein